MAARHEAARDAILTVVAGAADSTGGLLVKRLARGAMMLFATPDAAASAASKIQAAVDRLPELAGTKAGVHLGFHSGPVVSPDKADVDRTVTLAWQLAHEAQDGQTLTSEETAQQLNPALRSFSRCHHAGSDTQQTWLFDVASWHRQGVRPAGWLAMAVLRLSIGARLVVCSRERDSIVIGRDPSCDLPVESMAASRLHCTIRHSDGSFSVHDHSNNGTYLRVAAGIEIPLRNAEFWLPEEGLIGIGDTVGGCAEVVQFSFALVT